MQIDTLPPVEPVQDLIVATWLHKTIVFCVCHKNSKPSKQASAHIRNFGWLGSGGFRHTSDLVWGNIAALHMLMDGSDEVPHPGDLGRETAAVCESGGWDQLLQLIVEGKVPSHIEPDLAGWMDAGLLAREITRVLPDIDDMLDVLGDIAPGELWSDVRECVDAHY